MINLRIQPSRKLSPFVEYYKYNSTEDWQVPHVVNMLSNGFVELFFLFEDVHHDLYSKEYFIENKHILLVGIHNIFEKSLVKCHSYSKAFSILFKPLGFYFLFKIKECEVTNKVIDGTLLPTKEVSHIWEKIQQETDPYRMAAIVNRLLGNLVTRSRVNVQNWVNHIISKMIQFNGQLSINTLSQESGTSVRTLERNFHQYLGISPKDYNFIFQVNHLFKLATIPGKRDNLCQFSLDSGFFDQSHFIHTFQKLTNTTPSEYFQKVLNIYIDKSFTDRIGLPIFNEEELRNTPFYSKSKRIKF